MIVWLRTVAVPAAERPPYLAWIAQGRAVREAHGILAELVLEPPSGKGGTVGETVAVTIWPSHEVLDAWIATPERAALSASAAPRAVDCHPLTRYDVAGGYLDLPGLATHQPHPQPHDLDEEGKP